MIALKILAVASAFDSGVEHLQAKLMLLASVLVVVGIWESAWKSGSDPKAILGIILKTIMIVSLISGFPTLMKNGKLVFDGLRNQVTHSSPDKFKELQDADLPHVEPGVTTIGPYIASVITTFLQNLGYFGTEIVKHFQEYAIGCLIAFSPLMIGFLSISYTQNIGIKFLLKSLEVVMWSLGFVFADLFLNYLGSGILAGMLSAGIGAPLAGVTAIVSWPAAVGTMLIAALVPTFFYLATPMAVSALMSGANAGAAAAWGGLSNIAQGAQHVTRGGAALKNMQMASGLRGPGNQPGTSTGSTGGTIPRPPNPIA
jgi:hypothetical protein